MSMFKCMSIEVIQLVTPTQALLRSIHFERIEKMVLTMLICSKLCYCLVALDIIWFEI